MSIHENLSDQLDKSNGSKQVDIGKLRAPVNPHCFSLIIGLGGTGVDALVETKGLIQSCCEDSDGHVAYLGIDTSVMDLRHAKSSEATGKVGLAEHGEQCLLRSNGLGGFLAPALIQTSYRTSPEIFDWIDERITPTDADTGAGGIRQIGRLILTENFEKVRHAIEDAVINLAKCATGEGSKLNVYIMAGISGGTGSGTFIDMAYLVRRVLNEMPNFAQWGSIFGYLFMPDIHTAIMSQPYRRLLESNAYAALQELDYNLSIQELQENYDIKWGTTTVVPGTTPESIFDQIHLVSATDAAGHLLPNPRGTAVSSVAQSILHFVADECSLEGDFGCHPIYAMSDYYSNIDNHITNYLTVNQRLPHRNARYLAIGTYDFQLPADDTRSIEEAIAEQVAPGRTTEDAWKELFRLLLAESRPLFYAKDPDTVGGTQTLISVPEICPGIYHYILKQAKQFGGITVQMTKLTDCIYAQTVQCGITLANWQIVENAEYSYAQLRNMPGVHLIAPVGKYAPKDAVSWTEMSTLIPGYLRPEKEIMEENIRKLVEEEESKKAEIKNLCEVTETGIVSKSPAIEVVEDSYGICELCLIISNANVVRSDGFDGAPQLEICIGDDKEVFRADLPDAKEKLADILERGFAEHYKDYPAVKIKTERITFRQISAHTHEETLDYLTEQYITAIGNRHMFRKELAKYESIRDFLQR